MCEAQLTLLLWTTLSTRCGTMDRVFVSLEVARCFEAVLERSTFACNACGRRDGRRQLLCAMSSVILYLADTKVTEAYSLDSMIQTASGKSRK